MKKENVTEIEINVMSSRVTGNRAGLKAKYMKPNRFTSV